MTEFRHLFGFLQKKHDIFWFSETKNVTPTPIAATSLGEAACPELDTP